MKGSDIQIAGRKIISMKPDGNCFYCALSYQLFGTQEEYDIVHGVVYRTEMYNKPIFANYLIPGHDEATMDDHVKKISVLGTWATQVEVVAAASAFEIPVYFYAKKSGSDHYVWNVVQPFTSTKKQSSCLCSQKSVNISLCRCLRILSCFTMTLYIMMP